MEIHYESECVEGCDTFGHDKKTMIQCFGCKTWYHPACIANYYNLNDQVEIYKQIKAEDKWYCDVKQKCVFKRGGKYIAIYEKNLTL